MYDYPDLDSIKEFCLQQIDTLLEEVTRLDNPHKYYVDLSQKLWDIKYDLIRTHRNEEI